MEHNISIILLTLFTFLFILYVSPFSNTKFLDRPIWHKPKKFIDFELDSKATSQQVFDIYSFSHITHGILFYFILKYLDYNTITGLFITIILEILWEIIENTPFIINKYRQKPEYKNYVGDSIVNIIGDTIFTILGYYLSYKSNMFAILYLIISEIVLLPYKANLLHLSFGSLIQN